MGVKIIFYYFEQRFSEDATQQQPRYKGIGLTVIQAKTLLGGFALNINKITNTKQCFSAGVFLRFLLCVVVL